MRDDFWAISAYYNLAGWSSRPHNYRVFRKAMPLPLLTVEWHPAGNFQLGSGDADRLIQIAGGDAMWQKERLLGIALSALPAHVKYVVWVDADVLFSDADWHERTRQLLEEQAVVQPFSTAVYLDRQATRALDRPGTPDAGAICTDGLIQRRSFLDLCREVGERICRVDLDRRFASCAGTGGEYRVEDRPAYGHAWAARTDALRSVQFYERCVFGAGDLLSCYGFIGHGEDLIANHRSAGWDFYGDCASYRAWMARAANVCGGSTGVVDGTLLHLFHGTLAQRQYKSRLDGLIPLGIDLDRDLHAAEGRPWSWARQRPEFTSYFLGYLRERQEDS
jgi:hypothetical protein